MAQTVTSLSDSTAQYENHPAAIALAWAQAAFEVGLEYGPLAFRSQLWTPDYRCESQVGQPLGAITGIGRRLALE